MPGYCVFYFLYKIEFRIVELPENIRGLVVTVLSSTYLWNEKVFLIT